MYAEDLMSNEEVSRIIQEAISAPTNSNPSSLREELIEALRRPYDR